MGILVSFTWCFVMSNPTVKTKHSVLTHPGDGGQEGEEEEHEKQKKERKNQPQT